MSLTVILDLPPEIAEELQRETPDLSSDVTEAYAVELYRRGKLSHYQLSVILRLDRFETDAYLVSHRVFEGSPTMADLDSDRNTLACLIDRTRM